MHRISRRMVAVLVVIGAIAAGGAAFTASNTVPDTTAGYGTSTITGATATDIAYGLRPTAPRSRRPRSPSPAICTNDTVKAGFETNNLTTCSTPVYDGTTSSTSTCSGYTESTATSASLQRGGHQELIGRDVLADGKSAAARRPRSIVIRSAHGQRTMNETL